MPIIRNSELDGEDIEIEKNIYSARIHRQNGRNSVKPFLKNENSVRSFSSPETQNDPKIYVIRNIHKTIIYVGKTIQSVSARIWQGVNPRKDNGYHGYKWKEKDELTIECFTIKYITTKLLEATEAELVFLLRLHNDKWPIYQTEIHFANIPDAKIIAKKIYDNLDN